MLAWFAILFTGRYPGGFFAFTSGVLRWTSNAFVYATLMRDEYPPFGWEPGDYPLDLDIPPMARQSRLRLFVRAAAVLPNYFAFMYVALAGFVVTFIASFAILFTGRYPRGLFRFSAGVHRWWNRQAAYLLLLRDEYPPYSVSAAARPGNEALSFVIGLPLFVAYMALSFAPAVGLFLGGDHTTQVDAALLRDSAALERAHPSASANNLRVTLEGYEDAAIAPPGADAAPVAGHRFVAFDLLVEKTGRLPAFYTPLLFTVKSCAGETSFVHANATMEDAPFAKIWWRRGHSRARVYFEVRRGDAVCDLIYRTGAGSIRFRFE